MPVLRFAIALVVTSFLHSLGVRVWGDFAMYFDLFLLLTVAWAFESSTLTGLAVGLAAGLTADGFSGGLYGLNGFANTLIGYSTAFAVANLAKMNTSSAALLYALAAVAQQSILLALVLLMVPEPAVPPLVAMISKVAITATLGAVVFKGRRKFFRMLGSWRRTKESQLRF